MKKKYNMEYDNMERKNVRLCVKITESQYKELQSKRLWFETESDCIRRLIFYPDIYNK